MVSVGSSSLQSLPPYGVSLQKGRHASISLLQASPQGLRQRQLSDAFTSLIHTQGLRQRQPWGVSTPLQGAAHFGLNPSTLSDPKRFSTLPIQWPAHWSNDSAMVEGYPITEVTIRELFENAAKQATMAVKQIPLHDSEDGFGASAVVLHNNQPSVISGHNNKVPRLDEGPTVYCAERTVLLNASGSKGDKGFIPLLVVINDEAPWKSGVSYSSCGPCLDEIRSAVLGTHPTAKMNRDSLIAFVDTRTEKPRIVMRRAGELFPVKAVTSYSNTPVWKLSFDVSERAKQLPMYQKNPWLFRQWIRLGVWKARRQAHRAEKIGFQNDKGPSVGSVVLKKAWYGYRLFAGNNAYIKTRRYSAPFQNTLEALGRQQRTQIQGGILVSNKPKVNVVNLEDLELLSYTAKEKENLFIITVNGPTVSIKTYLDYVPYPYHRAHHVKKPANAGF